jgi:hypothetical protein
MYDKHTVLGNCRAASGYQGANVLNISAKHLFDLLDSHAQNGSGEFKRKCKDMLTNMNTRGWQITAGIHAGGIGGGGRAADPRSHITLQISNVGTYHLRLSTAGIGFRLMEITP